MTCDPPTLLAEARCFADCIPKGHQWYALIRVFCDIPPIACSDADAQNFITRAGITDATQKSAICQLVTDLKAANVWNSLLAFYPIVGGSASQHSHNLRSSSYQITWNGGLTHDANGVKGNGTTGYGQCVGLKSNLTTGLAGVGAYLREATAVQPATFIGLIGPAASSPYDLSTGSSHGLALKATIGTGAVSASYNPGASVLAAWYCGDRSANNRIDAYKNGVSVANDTNNVAPTTDATDCFVLARDNAGTADQFTNLYFGAFAFFNSLDAATHLAFYNAVQTFQTALGRQV